MKFLIDTNVYGTFFDGEENSMWVLDYAKKNREQGFISAIVILEASKFKKGWDEIRPKLFECNTILIEPLLPNFRKALNLAWKYIQELKLAGGDLPDAELVAFASLIGLDMILTKNKRGIFDKDNYRKIRKINMRYKLKTPQMKTPEELKQFLTY